MSNVVSDFGAVMPPGHPMQGWVNVGISPSTGTPLYIAPNESVYDKENLPKGEQSSLRHRLPTIAEVREIFAQYDGRLRGVFNPESVTVYSAYWATRNVAEPIDPNDTQGLWLVDIGDPGAPQNFGFSRPDEMGVVRWVIDEEHVAAVK